MPTDRGVGLSLPTDAWTVRQGHTLPLGDYMRPLAELLIQMAIRAIERRRQAEQGKRVVR
jgi:hypothetical protein